jgi:hypothetical protein
LSKGRKSKAGEGQQEDWSSAWENDQMRPNPATAVVCWEILNWLGITSSRQVTGWSGQNTNKTASQRKGGNPTRCQ